MHQLMFGVFIAQINKNGRTEYKTSQWYPGDNNTG